LLFNGFDYDIVDRCVFETSPAIRITGRGATFEITRSIFDANAPSAQNPIIKVDAQEIDVLKIERNTFNLQPNANIAFDNFVSPPDGFIGVMRVVGNEFDGPALLSDTSSRIILGKNIANLTFDDNQVQEIGNITDSPVDKLTSARLRKLGGLNRYSSGQDN
jgi:hypothetical protein